MKRNPILTTKAALLAAASLGLTLAHGQVRRQPAGKNDLIPPSTPLVACDPYFSIWSPGDTLNGVETTHWTGRQHQLSSLVKIDGKAFRVMGATPVAAPALEQKSLTVLPTRTIYTFEGAGVALTLTFTTPALPEDMEAAWVTDVRMIKDTDAKIFSTAGGDPAINGLYTYLAMFTAPEGWTRVFLIGDFNSWEVVEETPERVVLKVSRSWIEEGSGDIKTAEEHLILGLPTEEGGALEVTPAG